MKFADKFLIAIVAGVILLVAATFIIVLRQPEPSYQSDETPEGVILNYLLALQQEDYARAYGYLSPTLSGYPATQAEFASDVYDYRWQFGKDDNEAAFAIIDTHFFDTEVIVSIEVTHFNNGGLFDSGTYTDTGQFTLAKFDGEWKIVEGEYTFWVPCWSDDTGGCQ